MKLLETLSKRIRIDKEISDFFEREACTTTFKKGEMLSQQNGFSQNVYFMDSGLARMFYYENGKDITTNFYPEERIFANIDTIFKDAPSIYNIETLEESTITFCDYRKLDALCSVSLTAANFGRYILGNLLTQMAARVASLQYMTAKEKYAQLMEENPDIILRAPLGMIASYLGISQETLSRIRSER